MSTLQAIPTDYGIGILNSELKETVTKYQLIGARTYDASSDQLYSFYSNAIETSYYDENGVLTFVLNLPIETHFDEYLYKIYVVDNTDQVVIECETPKIALAKGIGGMVTLKVAITGESGEVIFKNGDFVTESELTEVHLSQYPLSAISQFLPYNPTRIYSVGEVCYTKDAEGKVLYWEWYSNVESLAGKDPLNTLNRQTGWIDEIKPFYWTPFKKSRSGSTQWPWMSMTFPEGTLNVLGNSVPSAVFWRLAEALPEFVNAGTGMIDFPETGGEFFRVLDQGRGVDSGRVFASSQSDAFKAHYHTVPTGYANNIGGTAGSSDIGTAATRNSSTVGGSETRPRNLAFPILVEV
ncbi:hypothetical protein [Vibrio diazotrophicus]|uniref:hypothetical protein n=1 Tax=Vibrio diazotrophicus TaxID=685 RepID=UPI0015E06B23|nr:hypothetical protein [Vibrio diazotrophicus]